MLINIVIWTMVMLAFVAVATVLLGLACRLVRAIANVERAAAVMARRLPDPDIEHMDDTLARLARPPRRKGFR
jgi:hypothetical protein